MILHNACGFKKSVYIIVLPDSIAFGQIFVAFRQMRDNISKYFHQVFF